MSLIYDDVAFYFLVQTLLTVFLIPATIYVVYTAFASKKSSVSKLELCDVKDFDPSANKVVEKETCRQKYFKWKYIFLAIFWVFFIFHTLQMPSSEAGELTAFQPYAILGLEKGAPEAEIKQAYRRLSLKWHPDKNLENRDEAEKQFILVSKAYQTLTDPAYQENMEKWGNPDGFQGVSVSIGLPKFLTKKENSLRILLVYFVLLIVLPPIGVYAWWRSASKYHESGVMHVTLGIYWRGLTEHMGPKQLIDVFAASAEFVVLQERPTNEADFKKLFEQVKDSLRVRYTAFYMTKANVLLTAYLRRIAIPESLQEDLKIILKSAHRLLHVMSVIAVQKGMPGAAMASVELMQWIAQAVYSSEYPLLQLPHFTAKENKMVRSKKLATVADFKRASTEKKRRILKHWDSKQWEQIDKVTAVLPDIDLAHTATVEDEEGIYEEDILTVKVTLKRADEQSRPKIEVEPDDDQDNEEEDDKKPKPPAAKNNAQNKNAKKTNEKGKQQAKKGGKDTKDTKETPKAKEDEQEEQEDTGNGEAAAEKTDKTETEKEKDGKDPKETKEDEEDEGDDDEGDEKGVSEAARALERELAEREKVILETLPFESKDKHETAVQGPPVHSVFFPFPKREEWVIFLLAGPVTKRVGTTFNAKQGKVVGFQRLAVGGDAGSSNESVIRFRLGPKGVWPFQLHALCDSYVGCDQQLTFDVVVHKMTKQEQERRAQVIKGLDTDELEEEIEQLMEEPKGKWYYCGCTSFWEMIANGIVLAVMAFFAYNFLQTHGYWQKYAEPLLKRVSRYTNPVWVTVEPIAGPIIRPVGRPVAAALAATWAWLYARLTNITSGPVDEEFLNLRKPKRKRGKGDL